MRAIRGHGPLLRLFWFQALSGAALAQQEQPFAQGRRAGATRHLVRMIGGLHPPYRSHSHTRSSAGVGL
ncbi:hypothetical protein D9M71_849560 [compost metagenome]